MSGHLRRLWALSKPQRGRYHVTSGRLRLTLPTILFVLACTPALVVLGYYFAIYLGHVRSIMTFPYGWDYGEAPELNRAIAVAQGRDFYHSWLEAPYTVENYTPLFAVLNGAAVRFLGPQYQSGRAIAWACTLLSSLGLAWLAWRESHGDFLAPTVAILLWFSSHYVWDWTPMGREDELAVLCSVGGLLVFYECIVRSPRHAGPLWPALACFLAAVFTRQSTVEAAIACSLYLLVVRPRRGVVFVMSLAATGGLLFLFLAAATHGAFLLDIIGANLEIYKFSWLNVAFHARQFWQHYQPAVFLAVVSVVCQLQRRGHALIILWTFVALAISVTVGKDGATVNYGLQLWSAVSLLAGLGVSELRRLAQRLWLARRGSSWFTLLAEALSLVAGVFLLVQAQLCFHIPYEGQWRDNLLSAASSTYASEALVVWTATGWYRHVLPWAPRPRQLIFESGDMYWASPGEGDRRDQAFLIHLATETRGDVIDEDMTHLLLSGKRIYIETFDYSEAASRGKWDEKPFVTAIDQQRFGLVIVFQPPPLALQSDHFTPGMIAAIDARYCAGESTARYYTLHPCAP